MDINWVTYIRVAAGLDPKPPVLHVVEASIENFLRAHIDDLLSKAKKNGAMPPAQFTDGEAQELFRNLYRGTEGEFLESAHQLATRLIGRMNGATADGLLLALRAETDTDGRVAGLLKLQVVAENGAVLQRLESGELQLSAVRDLLEKPGDLQKGALTATSLPDGEVYCADNKMPVAARYFPEAFGIRLFAKPSAATRTFFDIAQRLAPGLVTPIAESWPTLQPGTVRKVMGELGERIPEVTPELQEEMIGALEASPRPVIRLDTTRRVKESYKIGGITLDGPIEEMRRKVEVSRKPGGGWQITINSEDEPQLSHSSWSTR
jgi:hypothetical protein